MKTLRLKDGTELTVRNESRSTKIVADFQTISEVVSVWEKMTKANLAEITLGDATYTDLAPAGMSVTSAESEVLIANFFTRARLLDAVEVAENKVRRVERANEILQDENRALADGSAAWDIISGGLA